MMKTIELLVAKIVALAKNRPLFYEETAAIIDVTEHTIERPKKNKSIFLGRKKT